MFPRIGGNAYYSPGMIMTGMGVLIEELRIAFGLFVQSTSSTMPHNSLATQTRSAIALGSMGNATGGQVLLALDTGKLLRRSHVKVVTMTAEVIAQVNHLRREKHLYSHSKTGVGSKFAKEICSITFTTTVTLVKTQTLWITSQE